MTSAVGRYLPRGVSRWLCLALLIVALPGCGEREASLSVLANRCVEVGGSREVWLRIIPPAAGVLRLVIEEEGISVAASVNSGGGSFTARAVSPVERMGRIALVATTRSAEAVTMTLVSNDSPEIRGRACVSADFIGAGDVALIRAERAFALAGEAAFAEQWQKAFDQYLIASRIFAQLKLRRETVAARHALADLAYKRLHRERDSYALVSVLLGSMDQSTEAHRRGVLALLLAKTLIDGPKLDSGPEFPRTRARLVQSRKLLGSSPRGEREQPRVDIIDGFRQYHGGRSDKAYELFTRAARHCEKLKDWECYARARQNIAAVAEERQDYAFAMQVYEDALRHAESGPAFEMAADISGNLGRLQRKVGLFGQSELTLRMAMRLFAQRRDCDGTRHSIASLGKLLVDVGSLGDAPVLLEQAAALDCAQLLAHVADTVPANTTVAGSPAEPRLRFDGGSAWSSVTPCSHLQSPDELTLNGKTAVFDALVALSEAFLAGDDIPGAVVCAKAAKPFGITLRSRLHFSNHAGTVLLAENKPVSARSQFQQTLRIADEASLSKTSRYRGAAHLGTARSALWLDEWPAARESSLEALRANSARADMSQVVESLRLLAASEQGLGDRVAAARLLRLAVRLMDQVPMMGLDAEKRATYLATQHAVFAELTDLAVERAEDTVEAAWRGFDVSEKGRARSLRQALFGTRRNTAAEAAALNDKDYRSLLERLARIAEIAGSSGALIEAIGALAPDDVTGTELIDRTLLARNLSRIDATLVAYASGRRNMYAFVMDRDRMTVVPLGSHETIARAAADLSGWLHRAEVVQSRLHKAAENLARLVWWPIVPHVTRERIVLVPDGALHTVPFALLPWSQASTDQLVVHRAETVLVPSATLMATSQLPDSSTNAARFDLIGDPIFRMDHWQRECASGSTPDFHSASLTQAPFSSWVQSLPRLPGTQAEVNAIAQLLRTWRPGSRIGIRLRCEATPEAIVSAARAGGVLLHIATHGHVDAHRPRLSALALTPEFARSGGGSSVFDLLNILDLRLSAKLVVLSASETSQGRLLPGEGVLGPAQAFLQAGAASVIASHWKVEDETTAAFMETFYEYLTRDRLPVSTALRRAQLDHSRRNPSHHWAAFSLYGRPDSTL